MAGYDEFTFDLPDAALENFSLMLDLSLCSASWWAAVDTSDGTKGRAYKQDGATRLAVDWIDFDDTAETGFARILWSGTLPTSGTIKLRIEPPQAANSSVAASDTYGSDNAYDANWAGYWPLDGDTNDRTSNANNPSSSISVTSVAAKVGGGYDFTLANSRIIIPEDASLKSTNITALLWLKPDVGQLASNKGIIDFNHFANNDGPQVYSTGTSVVWRRGDGVSIDDFSGGTIAEDTWNFIACKENGTLAGVSINGAASSTTTGKTLAYDIGTDFWIGAFGTASGGMQAVFDDIQWHTAERSDEWIKHEYDQTNAPATFWGTPTWVAGGATYTLTAAEGSFALTGVANGLAAARQLPAAVGAFTLSGPATGLTAARKLPATAGTFALTGIDAGLAAARKLPTTAGEFTLTGITTGLAASRKLPAAVGAFTLAGIDAVLTYNGINSYTLVCSAGTFTFTGIDAALTVARKLAAATGTLTLTGIDAGFTATRRMPCDVRAYTLTGQAVTLDYSGAVAPSFTIGRLHTITRPPKVHTITRPPKVHTIQP